MEKEFDLSELIWKDNNEIDSLHCMNVKEAVKLLKKFDLHKCMTWVNRTDGTKQYFLNSDFFHDEIDKIFGDKLVENGKRI